jgi:hypothetical protein
MLNTLKSFKTFFLSEAAVYAALKHTDLTKRGGMRLTVFTDKVKNGDPFLTTHGNVIIDKKSFADATESGTFDKKGFSATFQGILDKGPVKVQYPRDFYKTPDFGGRGVGAGTAAEDMHLSEFQKEMLSVMKKDKVSALDLVVGKRRLKNVTSMESTPGTPKADFHLKDLDGNEVGWISHKAGKTSKDFQQYGGITHPVLQQSKGVQKFIEDVRKLRPNGLDKKESFWREVKDTNVIHQSIWGIDYGKKRGQNNVDEFHQGLMKLKKAGKSYKIVSTHSANNGEEPKGEYDAYYVARYQGTRGQFGIGNVRLGVFPKGQKPKSTGEII